MHRGPDQQGVWESSTVSLGAVRLKIIDLEHGQQPMKSDDGDVVIVFNGEVYNHAEIRRELEQRGHRFHSRCDTEAVLRAYLEWGTESFQRLRGMFAFAIWTESDHRLILVRDRLGIKPLYFARRDGDLYFGSELKAIFEHPEIERRIDPAGLDHFLGLNWIPQPHTMVEGIEKLPPAHWLEWRDGRIRSEAYWTLDFHEDQSWTLGSAKERLDELMRSSIQEHLIADVPLGVWSSGGLDSSAIVHYASAAASQKLKTFSVSFKGRSFDETPWFREIAERYGTDHNEYDLQPESSLADTVEQFAFYSDEPSADAGALPVWFLSKMCRTQVTVALSGDGGDELFGGYNTYLADRYAAYLRKFPASLRAAALRSAGWLPVSDDKIGFEYKVKRLLAGAMRPAEDAHAFWNGTFSPEQRAAIRDGAGAARLPRIPEAIKQSGVLNRYLWLDQQYYLPDDILYKCDRMSMAHSLEVRPPFLDHRIVEFAASLPESFKVNGRQLKFVLRELMRDKLPRSILTRRKEGFDIPTHHWLRTTLRPLLLDTLNQCDVEQAGFRWPAVRGIIDAHMERRGNYGYHLWGLLILFLWRKRWKIETGPALEQTASIPVTH